MRNSEARQCCDLSTTENRAVLQNCRSNGERWREVYCALVTLTSGWTRSASAYRFDINILEFHCPVQFPIPQHFILHLSHAFIAYSELSPHVMFCSVCCCPLSARTRYTSRPSFEVEFAWILVHIVHAWTFIETSVYCHCGKHSGHWYM